MKKILLITFLSSVLFACKREEPTSWDVDVALPLAKGDLGLADLVADSLLALDADGVYHLVYEKNLTDFDLDTLVAIDDTVLSKRFVVPFSSGTFSIPPAFNLINYTEEKVLTIPTVRLKEVQAGAGSLRYRLKSYINGHLTCTYTIPGLTLGGNPVVLQAQTAPSQGGTPSVASGEIDLAGYRMDLTGQNGDRRNTLYTVLNVRTSDNAPANAEVNGQDSVVIDLEFTEARVDYARGYFGNEVYNLDQQVDFTDGFTMPEGTMNVEGTQLKLRIENYIGADARLHFTEFSGSNASLQNNLELNYAPLYQPLNITRATQNGSDVLPFIHEYNLDPSNSNLDAFLGNLPGKLSLLGTVQINPLGDVSDANDFIYTQRALNAWLRMDIPLRMSTAGLVLRDTLSLGETDLSALNRGELYIHCLNSFPLGGTVQLKLIDADGSVMRILDNTVALLPAQAMFTPAQPIAVSSSGVVYCPADLIPYLTSPQRLLIEARLETPQYPAMVELRPSMRLKFFIAATANAEVSYD